MSYEEYHPYGTSAYHAMASGVEVSAKRYRYTGKEKDQETGLYYHGARYYAPWLGRWTSADPAGMVDGPGLYNYAVCDPISLHDPTGKEVPKPGTVDYQIMTMTDAQLHAHMKALSKQSPTSLGTFMRGASGLFWARAFAMQSKYSMDVEYPFKMPPNMTIGGAPEFQSKVTRDLSLLAATPSGRVLFSTLEAAGQPVRIVPADPSLPKGDQLKAFPDDEEKRKRGEPTGTTITYNPDLYLVAEGPQPIKDASLGQQVPHPPQVGLGHEGVHAVRNALGTNAPYEAESEWKSGFDQRTVHAERMAIGLEEYKNEIPTENSFRRDLGLPLRGSHTIYVPGEDLLYSWPPAPALRPGGPK
ncbi:M91 family zinc metallopeptidase [Polyangium sp. rjm3]|uniref:M91 family zinc metallopeptidase n=2 Tax=Polyangium mundeleinium TaxID=2995306 RepID=A0ABT5EZ39_9BACT|nr:M91 family zinc metallopeptidase [Polyangium mundeleinium]